MNLLIAFNSCAAYERDGVNDQIRNAWLKDCPIPYEFFVGHGGEDKSDVVKLDCFDDYYALGPKCVEKFKWALNRGYDFVFSPDCDTYVCPERLLTCGFEQYDYFGDFLHKHPQQPWPHSSYGMFCQAGPGYFVSAKAMHHIIADYGEVSKGIVGHSDNLIGDICRAHADIKIGDGGWDRFATLLSPNDHGPRKTNNMITAHLSTVRPDNDVAWWWKHNLQGKLYREWLES